jgi:hypothetical protein
LAGPSSAQAVLRLTTIRGREQVEAVFKEENNCKDSRWRWTGFLTQSRIDSATY